MFFHKDSIDFVKTYNNIYEEFKPKKSINKIWYSLPVVKMAEAVIHRNINKHILLGIKRCIEYELKQCEVNYASAWWCKHKIKVFEDYDERLLISDSIILTILKYRYSLDEKNTGLSNIVMCNLAQGIEWVGNWSMRSYPISKNENKFIATHDIDDVIQYISEM